MLNLTSVPNCGVSCLAAGLSHSTCPSTNETCLCVDPSYNNWVTSCVLGHCSVKDQLRMFIILPGTQRATSLGCGVPITNYYDLKLLHGLLFAFQSTFFLLRIANRALLLAPWGWDDTTITIAWVLSLLFLGAGIAEADLDAGQSIWSLEFWQIDYTFLVVFIFEVLYTLMLATIKISICFVYIRIFLDPTFRRVMWATQVFNVLLVLTFLGVDFGQCRPLSYFWLSWDGEHKGTCINISAMAYAHAAINIALDVWMLVLPATQIWSLNMPLRRKLEVMAMFACGMFLTAVSIVRITKLGHLNQDSHELDWKNYYQSAIWSVIELEVGIMVACLPAARIVVAKYATSIMESAGWLRVGRSDLPSYTKKSDKSSSSGNASSHNNRGGLRRYWLPMPALGRTHLMSGLGTATGLRTSHGPERGGNDFASQVELIDVGVDGPPKADRSPKADNTGS